MKPMPVERYHIRKFIRIGLIRDRSLITKSLKDIEYEIYCADS